MNESRQFSLRYLLLEMIWIALALGLTRMYFDFPSLPELGPMLLPALGMCWGAAAGGLRRNMMTGAVMGLIAGMMLLLWIPAFWSVRE